jgi:hypothetical protein
LGGCGIILRIAGSIAPMIRSLIMPSANTNRLSPTNSHANVRKCCTYFPLMCAYHLRILRADREVLYRAEGPGAYSRAFRILKLYTSGFAGGGGGDGGF